MNDTQITAMAQVLGLSEQELHAGLGAHWFPNRTLGPAVPTDPLIYRLYEVRVYIRTRVKNKRLNTNSLFQMYRV